VRARLALLLCLTACTPGGPGATDGEVAPGAAADAGAAPDAAPGELREGLITYYDADGTGNCSFDASPDDLDVAAIVKSEYEGSAVCGACAEVHGPLGAVRVRIVDSCPDCTEPGHLDLSPQAFAKVARLEDGRVRVRWRFVPCPVSGPVRYRFNPGANEWWTALQVRNHRLPIRRFEWWNGDRWVEVPRADDNYFVEADGMGPGPLRVRVTASSGQTLEDTLPAIRPGETFDGHAQFDAPE
jgi:expansin (peptidoglycan-binding protein)